MSSPTDQGVDQNRRQFLVNACSALGGLGVLCAATPLVSSWLPSQQAEANAAPVTVDLRGLEAGQLKIIQWRGKPVWILKRTEAMLQQLQHRQDALRDPLSLVPQQPKYAQNSTRSIQPEYLVLIGVCTHLGCSPKYTPEIHALGPQWEGGFYCPCHGSTFDLAGRVFKGVPAPINLEVPPHRFLDNHTLVVGEEA